MAVKNLFIVNTPFHLLTAFILSKYFAAAENYLALIHPHGYDKWESSDLMKYLSAKECGYKAVFPLGYWLSSRNKAQSYYQQGKNVKETIGRLGIDNIYLGSDIDVQNQLLVAALGKSCFYRYEDGLYSYYNADRRRPFFHMIFHKSKIYLMKHLAGFTGNVAINTSTASASRAGIGDFMYKPQLLKRYSPAAHEITQSMINTAMKELQKKNLLQPQLETASVLYLSQPLVEQKKFTLQEEFTRLKSIIENLPAEYKFLYKPHPNDSSDKLEFYKKNLPQLDFYQSVIPVELLFASEKNLTAVISYQSTALLFTDKFASQPIKAISLLNFYKEPIAPAYIEIMKAAGVIFPNDIKEIKNYF